MENNRIEYKRELIEMTLPGKPNSRLQKYRLTNKGKVLLATGDGGHEKTAVHGSDPIF